MGQGRTAYDKVVRAVQQWKHMDLGWTTVHADSPVKGNLVCILPHIVVPWMKLPLQVTFVDHTKCRKHQQKGWTGDSFLQHIHGPHSMHTHGLECCRPSHKRVSLSVRGSRPYVYKQMYHHARLHSCRAAVEIRTLHSSWSRASR